MNSVIRIFVPGIPQPGGSKRGFYIPKTGRVAITEDNKKSKPWRAMVAWAASEIIKVPLQGPLEVRYLFLVTRPKGHFGAKGLRPSAPLYPIVKPDVTKLIRSTEDAMKGIAWVDDSQIARQQGEKTYADRAGCWIVIRELAGAEETETPGPAFLNADQVARQMGMRWL